MAHHPHLRPITVRNTAWYSVELHDHNDSVTVPPRSKVPVQLRFLTWVHPPKEIRILDKLPDDVKLPNATTNNI